MNSTFKIPVGLRTALLTITWFPVGYVFANHVYQPCQITGRSMSPTFNPGTETSAKDIALIQKFNLKKPDSLVRGDVIMIRSPSNPEKLITKRVVGLQGEIVKTKLPPYPKTETRVPRNHLWVEGDNGFHSVDSNTFGPISQALVVGKVVGIIWPPSRIGLNIRDGGRDARKSEEIEDKVKLLGDI
ncbi:uncharacterized protein PRCAT00002980001 [Priceomyces carsonii]|uniref:uncharacterized protein n=1 Tax=Priceomyces carsonii TaxID=28549 RepID=UPI002ED91C7E|nr:unnamed protein product [Priceomyces carsonii]